MKFKLAYLFVAYEVVSFVNEMYKRKATSVRFELQEKIGTVNLYIDDVSFKQINGKIAWKIVKSMYDYLADKANSKKEFDKNENVEATIDYDDFKNYKLDFLPLPKGKCLRYSYITKPSGIYEVSFSLVANDLQAFIQEQIRDVLELDKHGDLTFEHEENNETIVYDFEALTLKKEKIRVFLEDSNEESQILEFPLDFFESKSTVKEFFKKFKVKNQKNNQNEEIDDLTDHVEKQVKKEDVHW